MDTIYKIAKTFDKMLKFKMNIKNKTFPDYIPFIKKAFEILFRMTGKYLFHNFKPYCDQGFTKHQYHIQIVNFTLYFS